MAISNGFWPLSLSVESLVLREMVPTPGSRGPRGPNIKYENMSGII
jgi:hypothetical protein